MQNITPATPLADLMMHQNDIIRRHALGILKEGRRQRITCNNCNAYFTDNGMLARIDDMRACPHCKTDAFLMDITN